MRDISLVVICAILFISCGSNPVKKKIVKSDMKPLTEEKKDNYSGIVSYKIEEVIGDSKDNLGKRSMGNAVTGEVLSDKFAIENNSDKPVVILDVTTGCKCIYISYSKQPIKKGEKAVVDYKYDTRGKKGSQFSELTIKTNIGSYLMLIDLYIK